MSSQRSAKAIKAKNRVIEFKKLGKQLTAKLKRVTNIITTLSKPHVDDKVLAKSLVARANKVQKALTAATAALRA